MTGYSLFISDNELDAIVDFAKTISAADPKEIVKKLKARFKDNVGITIDVAAFGRMQASAKHHEVYAAVQVAHAIGVSRSEDEFDYFTTVDDLKQDNNESGASFLSSTSANSACYYFYANVCVNKLIENLGDKQAAIEAVGEFVKAFSMTNPSGKENAFAQHVEPAFVMVEIHDRQPLSLVNAFEKPIVPSFDKSLSEVAIKVLMSHEKNVAENLGFPPRIYKQFIYRTKNVVGKMPLSDLCKSVVTALKENT